ncbi:MAG TPA: cbb3-type cytochrome c oxidase subunit I [Methylomirabilota bacterium]|nr:cbb3-type cytochrome c oxidase subunit I [Methylomirabilota bacterium]
MPPLIRRYIKTSFAFLIVGVLLGSYVSVGQYVVGAYPPRLIITAHVHVLLVGFMLMIVMGVATWMFPRPARDDARYRPELAEAVYWTMTVATCVRAGAEILGAYADSSVLRAAIALGGLGQAAGVLLFVINMWTRVRMPSAAPQRQELR